jgi:hypothetical protein
MLRIPRAAGPGFFSALCDDVRKVAEAASLPSASASMVKAGLKVGIKVAACVIAAHELQTHAGRLLGEASGEIHVFEGDEFDETTKHLRENAYNIGTQNGALEAWLHASQHYGFPVPPWVIGEIKRLSDAGQWHGAPVVFEQPAAHVPAQGYRGGLVDEDQAVADAELVDEQSDAR